MNGCPVEPIFDRCAITTTGTRMRGYGLSRVKYTRRMNNSARVVSVFALIATLGLSALFTASFFGSIWIETLAAAVIKPQIISRVASRLDRFEENALVDKARAKFAGLDARIAAGREKLEQTVSKSVDDVAARMANPTCECRKTLSEKYREAFERDATNASLLKEKLTQLVETKYGEVASKLLREWRIFTGVNAVAFSALLLLSFYQSALGARLLPVALVMITGVALTSWFYLFNQDWFGTVLFGAYVGWGYALWLTLVFALLADLALNRARVTSRILSSIGVDSAPLPC